MTGLFFSHKVNFKTFCLAVILICCLDMTTAHGQTAEAQPAGAKNSLVKGAWALQFQINNNFSLSSFQGSTLSAKRHYSNKKAVRFGISLNGSFSDQDQVSRVPGAVGPKNEIDENNQSIGVNTQYAIYPSPDKSANFFFGAGPFLQFSRSSRTSTSIFPNNAPSAINQIKNTAWSTGISGVLGVEWFATRTISLLAEYNSTLGYNSSRQTETSDVFGSWVKRTSKGLQLGSGFVKFGLSVYF